MAAADPVFESLQRIPSMMESFDESLSQFCKDNISESALDMRKNLMEYYRDLHKVMQSRYETLKIKEKKPEEPGTRGKNEENKTSRVTGSSPAISSFTKDLSSVNVRPEIKTLCDKADGRGLRNYIMDNMKEVETLRNELSVALSKAPDAAKLVMDALEGYDFSESGSILGEKKKPPFSPNRKACILLLESLFPIFGNDDSGVVPSDVKDSAREIAEFWRKEMKIEDVDSASGLDVQAFLQLLASFRIAADYEKDELWGLLFVILGRKQAPELCWSLGLSSDIPDFIDKLTKSGRQLEALRYSHAFGMVDKADAVNLLKSYLRDVEKSAKELLMNGRDSAVSQNDSNTKMVSAMQTVIGLSKKYGLKSHYFEDSLRKKLRKLEQEKERKKNRKKESKKYAQERIIRKKNYKPKAEHREDRKKAAAERKAQRKEDRMRAADRSFTGLAAGAFISAPSIAAQKNDERRRDEGYPSAFGTSNLAPIGSSMYSSSVPSGAFAVPLSNVAEVDYEGRGQQSYGINSGEIDKNHVRASVYGTGGSAKSSVTQSNYNFEGRSQQNYKFNFGEIDNNPVRASAYGTGVLANSSATQYHYERGPALYTSAFGGGNTGSIGSSVYGSNSRTIHSDVNQGSYERSFGQYSGFAGRNMVPVESSGYGSGVSSVPPSNVNRGHFERRESVIDRHLFNSGLTSLPPNY